MLTRSTSQTRQKIFEPLTLKQFEIACEENPGGLADRKIVLSENGKTVSLFISRNTSKFSVDFFIPYDLFLKSKEKVLSILRSRLKMNDTVFARKCEVRKIEKTEARKFLDNFHVMGFAESAYNYGLFYRDELLAVATFSKGRKMNRLPEPLRSFELIRFCSRAGITVTGGLSKLVKHFAEEKKVGDIMTYVDRQFSEGRSFLKAGFLKAGETEPNYFLVNRTTFERTTMKHPDEKFDQKKYYRTQNSGNIKLIYTPKH